MAASTAIGADIAPLIGHGELFAEFPGRFVMATNDVQSFVSRAAQAGVPVAVLGTAGGATLRIGAAIDLEVDEIALRRRNALEDALAAVD